MFLSIKNHNQLITAIKVKFKKTDSRSVFLKVYLTKNYFEVYID